MIGESLDFGECEAAVGSNRGSEGMEGNEDFGVKLECGRHERRLE